MADHVYKTLQITGTSTESIEDATQRAIARCGESVNHLRWFEVREIRGEIDGGKVGHWQVTVFIGFSVDQPA